MSAPVKSGLLEQHLPIADIRISLHIEGMVTIYMPLLNEGTDAWRLVQVTPLEGAVYRVEGPMPDGEQWEFAPGTLVQCRWKKFSDGEDKLIAAGPAPTIWSAFSDQYKRTAGLVLGILPLIVAMQWLPRAPDGQSEPVPLLLTGICLALVSIVLMIWLKPTSLTGKWTLRSALGYGIFSCFIGLAS